MLKNTPHSITANLRLEKKSGKTAFLGTAITTVYQQGQKAPNVAHNPTGQDSWRRRVENSM